jgi:flagellum-specific peptidoglycan hydrolase FlgJ
MVSGEKKEVAKLEKMKEIQDTVKALKKQLEDIEKKDKDEEKDAAKKEDEDEDESHALLISEKRGQIFAEKEVNATKSETKNETKNAEHKSDASVANNKTTDATSTPKEGRYERFVKKLKENQ